MRTIIRERLFYYVDFIGKKKTEPIDTRNKGERGRGREIENEEQVNGESLPGMDTH